MPLQMAAAAVAVGWVATSLVPPADVARSGTASGLTEGMEKPRVTQRATTGFRQRVLGEDAGNSVNEALDAGLQQADDGLEEVGDGVDHGDDPFMKVS